MQGQILGLSVLVLVLGLYGLKLLGDIRDELRDREKRIATRPAVELSAPAPSSHT